MKKLTLFCIGTLFLLLTLYTGCQSQMQSQSQAQTQPQSQPQGGRTPAPSVPNPGIFIDSAQSAMDKAFNDMESEPSLEDAYYLGRAVAANIFGIYKPYTRNPELTAYLNKILQTLVINSSRPVAFKGYCIVILDSPEFNAFASPGGHIFLTKGLVEAATSEDTLAAVIAHELAHIILEHGLNMIKSMNFVYEAESLANRAAELSGKSVSAQRLLGFRSAVSSVMDTMVKNGYSQAQEFDADREAVKILAASGYNPGALTDMLQILQRVQGSQKGGFNDTHPSPAARSGAVQATVLQYRVEDTRSYRVPRFKNK